MKMTALPDDGEELFYYPAWHAGCRASVTACIRLMYETGYRNRIIGGSMMENKKLSVHFIARTAILLALTIVFQTIGRAIPLGQFNQFITGSLVNACLLIATATTGIWGGTAVAVLAPFGAILTGASMPLPFAPVVAGGNFILVLMFVLLKKNRILGICAGAVLKFAFLFAGVNIFVSLMGLPAQKAGAMIATFSWPQLVTAAIGGVLALLVLKALGRVIKA